MGSSGKLDVEVEVKTPADKYWQGIKESHILFPKAFPEQYKSIEVVEGDGKSVGSVRLIHFAEGLPFISVSKEKIEEVDETNKKVSYRVIDGDILKFYKNYKASLAVCPKQQPQEGGGGDGSLVKWSCEFEKASQDIPEPDLIREFAIKNFKGLDAYLLAA